MPSRMRSCLPIAVMLLVQATTSTATPILDQASPPPIPGASFGGGLGCPCVTPGDDFDIAQTLTVGRTGVLAGVDIFINATVGLGFPESDLLFDIRPTVAGVPFDSNAAALVALQISKFSVPNLEPDFFLVDLSAAHLGVAAGEQLTFVLRSDSGNFGFGGQTNNPYGGGTFYSRRAISDPAWSLSSFNGDLTFRTYVDETAQPVPEPITITLVMIGLPACFKRRPQ